MACVLVRVVHKPSRVCWRPAAICRGISGCRIRENDEKIAQLRVNNLSRESATRLVGILRAQVSQALLKASVCWMTLHHQAHGTRPASPTSGCSCRCLARSDFRMLKLATDRPCAQFENASRPCVNIKMDLQAQHGDLCALRSSKLQLPGHLAVACYQSRNCFLP